MTYECIRPNDTKAWSSWTSAAGGPGHQQLRFCHLSSAQIIVQCMCWAERPHDCRAAVSRAPNPWLGVTYTPPTLHHHPRDRPTWATGLGARLHAAWWPWWQALHTNSTWALGKICNFGGTLTANLHHSVPRPAGKAGSLQLCQPYQAPRYARERRHGPIAHPPIPRTRLALPPKPHALNKARLGQGVQSL